MELALLRALNDGDLDLARLHLQHGADPNHVLEEGGVAGVASMHMAAGLGTDALKLLLEFGGDPNVVSEEGVTPLHIAATWGELESVKLLLHNGGDPSIKDQDGLQAMDVALQYNHEAVVCLMKYHALLLVPEEEDDDEDSYPRFTRESLDSNQDFASRGSSSDLLNVSFLEDKSPDEPSLSRGSRVYGNSLHSRVDGYDNLGSRDITSPRHCTDFRIGSECFRQRHACGSGNEYTESCQHEVGYNGSGRHEYECNGSNRQATRCHESRRQQSCHRISEPVKHKACRDLFARRQAVGISGDCEGRYKGGCSSHAPGARHNGCDSGLSYTDSDPDCWEGGHGDVLRHGVRDFHRNLVEGCRNHSQCTARRSCCNHFQDVDRGNHDCSCGRRLQQYLSRSCDNDTFHHQGYDLDEENCSPTVKKIPSDPSPYSSHTPYNPQWTKLKDKQETSAEKVSRWQSSLTPSPNRFFAPLPDHHYLSPVGSPQSPASSRTPVAKSAPRRSSMYTSNIQRQIDQHIEDGRQVCLDVTSPGHPYIDFKTKELETKTSSPSKRVPRQSPAGKGKRLSAVSSVSASSCETFVTCDDDTEFTHVTPLDPTSKSVLTLSDDAMTTESSENVVVKVKSSEVIGTDAQEDKISVVCRVSGGNEEDEYRIVVTEPPARRQSNPLHVRERSPRKHDRHPSNPKLDHDLDLSEFKALNAKQLNVKTNKCQENVKTSVQTDIRSFSPVKQKWQAPVWDADLNVSGLITSDDSLVERKVKKQIQNGTNKSNLKSKWLPPSIQEVIDESDLMSSDESYLIRESNKQKEKDKISSLVDRLGKVSVKSKKSPVKHKHKKRVSLDSMYSNASVKEYLYKDKERGITLLERYVPSECEDETSRESISSSCSTLTINSEDTEIYDWQDYQSETDDGASQKTTRANSKITSKPQTTDVKVPIPRHLSKLSNEEIKKKLESLGDDPGPVVVSTRQTYLIRLASLEADPSVNAPKMKLTLNGPDYSPDLCAALQDNFDLSGLDELEDRMAASFQDTAGRCWREGTQKSSFNYLLLDPRVTRNLPQRAKTLSAGETFKAFIHAIFYIGKGKRARPYCHLYEAISQMQKPKPKVSTKVQHILDIWQEGLGVVSLHIFQSVIPVEAYTREACMVEAFGLNKLTNMKRGDYYGVASTWPIKTKRRIGVHLLKKALQIFLSEGERQICPVDIKKC